MYFETDTLPLTQFDDISEIDVFRLYYMEYIVHCTPKGIECFVNDIIIIFSPYENKEVQSAVELLIQ